MPRSPEKILARFWNNLDSLEGGLVLRITRPQILNPSLRIHSTSPARFWEVLGLGFMGFGSKGLVFRLNFTLVGLESTMYQVLVGERLGYCTMAGQLGAGEP